MVLGDPPTVVPGRLIELQERFVHVLADREALGHTPAIGHLMLVRLMYDGRSVAFHARVHGSHLSKTGPVLELERPSEFLVVQARRAFRIPLRGLEVDIELDVHGVRDATLVDLSLGGGGVQIEGRSLAIDDRGTLKITHDGASIILAIRCVAVHGEVHGLELLPHGDLQKERLRKLVMGIERAWLLRERRVR